MLCGGFLSGEALVGDSIAPVQFSGYTDRLLSVGQDLHQEFPWLHLWDVATPSGTLYLCSFADPDQRSSSVAAQVTFAGNEYAAIHVTRSDFEITDEGQTAVTVTVHDPLRVIDRTAQLDGYSVTMWLTRYDLLVDGTSAAHRFNFRIQSVTSSATEDLVSITLGLPSLFNQQFPKLVYNTRRCVNDWNLRRDYLNNPCTYPSDEFELATKQAFYSSVDTATELRHGWWVLNGDKDDGLSPSTPLVQESGVYGGSDLALYVIQDGNCQWVNTTREGLYAYKRNGFAELHDIDFDICTKLGVDDSATTKQEWAVGLLVQSESDESTWLFWGLALESTGTPARVYRKRSTSSGTSSTSDVTISGTEHDEFRLVKSGNDFTMYTRAKGTGARTDDSGTWTQRATQTLSVGSLYRVGLVVSSDFVDGNKVHAYFYHWRVRDGFGHQTCGRSFVNCASRDNTYQFNAFRGMPDGSTFVR